jgi:hypothetical protein
MQSSLNCDLNPIASCPFEVLMNTKAEEKENNSYTKPNAK